MNTTFFNSIVAIMDRYSSSSRSSVAWSGAFLLLFLTGALVSTPIAAQQQANPFDQLKGLPQLDLSGGDSNDPISLSGKLTWDQGSDRGRLSVTAKIGKGWHLYSITQPPGGPKRTKLTLKDSQAAELIGPFAAETPPKRSMSEVFGINVEEHVDAVTWTAPIRKTAEVVDEKIEVTIELDGLVCSDDGTGRCLPVNAKTVAKFDGTYEQQVATGEYRGEGEHIKWKGWIEPGEMKPGGQARLVLEAIPDPGYHIYPVATSAEETKQVTLIALTMKSGLNAGPPQASNKPVAHELIPNDDPVIYHEGNVQWRIDLRVPMEAEPGLYRIAGLVGYQVCTERSCDQPTGLEFAGRVQVDEETAAGKSERVLLAFEKSSFKDVAESESLVGWVDEAPPGGMERVKEAQQYGLAAILGLALLGGFILNFMPCVLPVIGLKVMSIASGGGLTRRESMALNLAYTGGVMLVFWILAAIAVAVRLILQETFAWGEQFSFNEFKITLCVVFFAMALSLLGVWEIPIPGFAGGRGATRLQKKEGLSGSFFKGVFSTILATPCSGPGLGIAFAYAVGQPVWVTVLIFTAIGLGMAFPFLILALVPGAARFLPKPGPWMDTFKQILAFPLLAAVVWLISAISNDLRIATLALLIGVWFACWLIGRVPVYADLSRRIPAWLTGIAVAALVGVGSFGVLVPRPPIMAWRDYSEPRLTQLLSEGQTVMVDFTADWCLNCKVNYNFAINTESVAKVVDELNAVPMLADWSEESPEIKRKLAELDSASIPLLAIYPGNAPDQPIVLRDLVTQAEVIEALRRAGPSAATDEDSPPEVTAVARNE